MPNSKQQKITIRGLLVLIAILFIFYAVAEISSRAIEKKRETEKVSKCDQPYNSTADYYNREFLGTCGYTPEMYRVVEKFEFTSKP